MFFKRMFKDRAFWTVTLTLAIPIALQNLLSSSLSLVDSIMVGKLGDIALSAVGEAAQVANLHNVCIFGICSGGTVFAAQYWGARNIPGIRKTCGLVIINCAVFSSLFTLAVFLFPEQAISIFTDSEAIIAEGGKYLRIACLSFIGISVNTALSMMLRSIEVVKISFVSNAAASLANVFFNYVLIFGALGFPEMGIRGAALATVISSAINPAVLIIASVIKKYCIFGSPREMLGWTKNFAGHFFRIMAPVFANETLWVLGVCGINMVYGRMGEQNIAALTIVRTVESLGFVFFIGMCNACAVLIGKRIGEGNFDCAKEYSKRFLAMVPILSLLVGGTVLLLHKPILALYSVSEGAYAVAGVLLTVYCCELCFRNIPYMAIVGVFRAGGDTKIGMLYDLGSLWAIALPIAAVLGLVLRLDFVLVYIIVLLSEDLIKDVLCIRYVAKGKWIKPVSRPMDIPPEQLPQ